jgi:phage portal protein BeeE
MGLLRRSVPPAFGSADIKAAAGSAAQQAISQVMTYTIGNAELRALQLPTISRARDLIASMIGSLDLVQYRLQWDPTEQEYEKVYIEGESWFTRPDPQVTRAFIMSNTFSDLLMYGRAFWYITSRYQTGYPASFEWLPAANINTIDQGGPQWFKPSDQVEFNGVHLPTENLIQFLSPIMGIVYTGTIAMDTAYKLDAAARRFSSTEIAAGYLQQRGGEPMTAEELGELAAGWSQARRNNAIGALNEFVEWKEFSSDPSKLQLVEARQYQALELARLANIPPYLVGAPTGTGMTYQNALQARQDLYLFGAKPYIQCIEQTLSGDNVIPRGRHIEFDLDDYLGDNEMVNTPLVDTPTSIREDVSDD